MKCISPSGFVVCVSKSINQARKERSGVIMRWRIGGVGHGGWSAGVFVGGEGEWEGGEDDVESCLYVEIDKVNFW